MAVDLPQNNYRKALLCCVIVVLLRGWTRLFFGDLWAEDGSVFLAEGLQYGFSSLFVPFAGSYHTLQRLTALLLIHLVPVSAWANAIAALSLALLAFVGAQIAKNEFRWLIPSDRARLWTAILICLAPGLREMAGNLANVNWILLIFFALTLLKEPGTAISLAESLACLLIITSVGTAILLVPLLLWRIWHGRSARVSTTQLRRDGCLLIAIILMSGWLAYLALRPDHGAGTFHFSESRGLTIGELKQKAPSALSNSFFQSMVYRPWLGGAIAVWLRKTQEPPLIARFIQLAVITFFVFVFKSSRRKPYFQALLSLSIGMCAWPLLVAIGRPGALDTFYEPLTGYFWYLRYSFPLGVTALLFWMGIMRPEANPQQKLPTVVFLFIVINLLHATDRFYIPPYRVVLSSAEARWKTWAPVLDRAMKVGSPRQLEIPIYPTGWKMQYSAAF